MTETVNSFHSEDFSESELFGKKQYINGKSRTEWEVEFGIVGMVEHLKESGWDRYQWRFVSEDHQQGHRRCFAEFFSDYYHGYLRGDGKTVREAVEKCLNTAQRFAKCGKETNHEYLPYSRGGQEYTNGLIACKHCGFNGHTTIVQALQSLVSNYKIHAQVAQEHARDRERHLEETGETWQQTMDKQIAASKESGKEQYT